MMKRIAEQGQIRHDVSRLILNEIKILLMALEKKYEV